MPGTSPHSLYPRNDLATHEPYPYPDPYHRHQSFMRLAHPAFHPSHATHIPTQQPPAPQSHKVWILDCKSCGTFFTNRGMKVGECSFCLNRCNLAFLRLFFYCVRMSHSTPQTLCRRIALPFLRSRTRQHLPLPTSQSPCEHVSASLKRSAVMAAEVPLAI